MQRSFRRDCQVLQIFFGDLKLDIKRELHLSKSFELFHVIDFAMLKYSFKNNYKSPLTAVTQQYSFIMACKVVFQTPIWMQILSLCVWAQWCAGNWGHYTFGHLVTWMDPWTLWILHIPAVGCGSEVWVLWQ